MSIPDDAPVPRLCHVLKWEDFDGYGFNLHTDKSRPGQYIGKVDEGSPAEAAGLKQGDRIIEVNGVNIANENHRQVVQRIKTIPDETRLLVVDTDTDDYYKSMNIVVKGTQSNIKYRKSPPTSAGFDETEESDDDKKSHLSSNTDSTAPQADEDEAVHKTDVCNGEVPQQCESPEPSVEEAEQEREQTSPSVEQTSNQEPSIEGNGETEETSTSKKEEEDKQEKEPEEKVEPRVEPPVVIEVAEPEVEKKEPEVEKKELEVEKKEPEIEKKEPEVESPEKKSPTPPESPVSSRDSSSPVSNGAVPEDAAPVRNGTGLNLNMTAAEMKAMLAQKKKRDPKKDNMDLRMKYKIVQSM